MQLYLMRHGMAEPACLGQSDAERKLTPEGIVRLKKQAIAFGRMGLDPQYVFCSAYQRARETADLIVPAFGIQVHIAPELKPGCPFEDMVTLLDQYKMPARVLLISHQPHLSDWIWQLTGARVIMRPGTLAWIEATTLYPRGGVLRGLYDSEVLAGLA